MELQTLEKQRGLSCVCVASMPNILGVTLSGVDVLIQAETLGHFLFLIWTWTSLGFYSSSPSLFFLLVTLTALQNPVLFKEPFCSLLSAVCLSCSLTFLFHSHPFPLLSVSVLSNLSHALTTVSGGEEKAKAMIKQAAAFHLFWPVLVPFSGVLRHLALGS